MSGPASGQPQGNAGQAALPMPATQDAAVSVQPVQQMPDAGSVVLPATDAGNDSGATSPSGKTFDAGTDPNRNHVQGGTICARLAQIQCAGEAFCCLSPGRERAACETAQRDWCTQEVYLDAISQRPNTSFDATRAASAFDKFEQLAAACDPSVAKFASSIDGLRGMLRGTLSAGASCAPGIAADNAMAAAALASCTDGATQACLPRDALIWQCSPKSAAGAACFTDVNCQDDLYCPNPKLEFGTTKCAPRKASGTSCTQANECLSLYCQGGLCVDATVQAAYCLAIQ